MALLVTDMEVAFIKGTGHTMAVLWSIRQVLEWPTAVTQIKAWKLGGATEPTSSIKSYLIINNQCGNFTFPGIRIF